MLSRCTGACLGLLAFAITIVAGLFVGNPPMVTLSRAVGALVVFCVLGLVVGAGAQAVVTEFHRQRERAELTSTESRADSAPPAPPNGEGAEPSGAAVQSA